MLNKVVVRLGILQFFLFPLAHSQSININPNQSINVKNTCVPGSASLGENSTEKIDIFRGESRVGGFYVDSFVPSIKITPTQYGKIGDIFTVFCKSVPMVQFKLARPSVKDEIKSSYAAYRNGSKIYIPNIYLDVGQILRVNGKDLKIQKDGVGKHIVDKGGSIDIANAEYSDRQLGRTILIRAGVPEDALIASRENFTDIGPLIVAYNSIKGVESIGDWRNAGFSKVADLARPNDQNNDICGSNIYKLTGLTVRQRAALGNLPIYSPIPVNPTGSLWPTGVADSGSVAGGDYSDVATLTNLKERHAKYAKNKVIIHILDTASEKLDDYSISYGQVEKQGHGSIIYSLIKEMIEKSGFKKYVSTENIDACDNGTCDPIYVIKKICEIATVARSDTNTLHIINLSMSSKEPQEFLRRAINDAARANVSTVMSSGNKTTCNGSNTGVPMPSCLLFPVDSFNISGFSEDVSRGNYVSTLNSTSVDVVNLAPRGIYSVSSLIGKSPDKSIIRERPFGNRSGEYVRSNIPSIYAPSAYYSAANSSLYAGTSFSAGYFSAALGLYRSCDKIKRTGPSIFSDDWAQVMSKTPSLSLDVDKMLAGVCY